MPNATETQELRPFLSIRWKLLGALVCVLLSIYILFVFQMMRWQEKFNVYAAQQSVVESKKALNTLLSREGELVYSSLLEIVADSKDAEDSFLDKIREGVSSRFLWLETTSRVNGIALMSYDNNILQQWGEPIHYSSIDSNKGFSSGFLCELTCFVYVSLPLRMDNYLVGNLLAYKKVEELIIDFSVMKDVVVNVFDQYPQADSAWSEELKIHSKIELVLPILNQLMENQKETLMDQYYKSNVFGTNYSVIISSFDDFSEESEQTKKWLFIKNIDDRNAWLQSLTKSTLLWIIVSFLISVLLLYLIVNRVSGQLPRILAMSRAINLEKDIENSSPYPRNSSGDKKILDDELQQYDRNLAKISHKLDVLREAESNNAIKLQTMIRELNQTKSFIDRLLNDEQTVIMVQRLGGEIIALNRAGCDLFEIEDFSGLTYSELLCVDIATDDGLAALNYLYLGGETLVKAETQWCNKAADVHTLLWVHALLSVPGTIDPIILSVCVDITAQRKAEDRLEWLAFNDPSLINYNKQVFLEYLPFAIARSLERHKTLALLYCEVSGLPSKTGMDNSEIRDKIIKDIGVRMSNCLRQYDMLTQLSDDHFVIILEGLSDISEAEGAILEVIKTYKEPVEVGRKEYLLNVVIGASYAPEHTDSVPELLRNAELAQCLAKQEGLGFQSAVIEN